MIAMIFALSVLIGVFGLWMQHNGQMSGLRNTIKRNSLRDPHGYLVRTKRLDEGDTVPFREKLKHMAVIALVASLVYTLVCLTGLMSFSSSTPLCLCIFIVMGVCIFLTYDDSGIWRPFAYAIGGFLAAFFVLSILFYALSACGIYPPTDIYNALTTIVSSFSIACCTAGVRPTVIYAREFEDGHIDAIALTANSMVAKRFDAIADPSWKPPRDKVDSSIPLNIHRRMEKHAHDKGHQ